MKRIFILTLALSFAAISFGQGRGSLGTIAADTMKGVTAMNISIGSFTGSYTTLAITAVCSNIGGTSDGTLTLYGSLDGTNYVFINGAADGGVVTASPKASITGTDMNQITVTDALVASWVVSNTPFRYYKVAGAGTTGDTTAINVTYMYK